MALTKTVNFKTALRRRNRIQVPRLLRWEFKLESSQVLGVSVHFKDAWRSKQEFYAQITGDGRINVPKFVCSQLQVAYGEGDMTGAVVEVELSPSEAAETAHEED